MVVRRFPRGFFRGLPNECRSIVRLLAHGLPQRLLPRRLLHKLGAKPSSCTQWWSRCRVGFFGIHQPAAPGFDEPSAAANSQEQSRDAAGQRDSPSENRRNRQRCSPYLDLFRRPGNGSAAAVVTFRVVSPTCRSARANPTTSLAPLVTPAASCKFL